MKPSAPERFLPRGQEDGEARIGQYGRAIRRTRGQKAPGPCGLPTGGVPPPAFVQTARKARGRGQPRRCGARPVSPHRPSRRAWRIATREPQRRLIPSDNILLQAMNAVQQIRISGNNLARRLIGVLLDIFFPPLCMSCRKRVSEPHALCAACWLAISFIEGAICQRCGTPFELDPGSETVCGACQSNRMILIAHEPFLNMTMLPGAWCSD